MKSEAGLDLVRTCMGDQLGILGAVGFHFPNHLSELLSDFGFLLHSQRL